MDLKFESVGKIGDFPISDIVGKFIVFQKPAILDYSNNLTLGYVFPQKEEGLLIAKIATAFVDENNYIRVNSINKSLDYKLLPQKHEDFTLDFSDVKDCEFVFTDKASSKIKDKCHEVLPFIQDVKREQLCQIKQLDEFRDDENPLIVNVDSTKVELENSGSYGFVGKFLENHKDYEKGLRVQLKLNKDNLIIDDDFMNSKSSGKILEIRSKLTDNTIQNKRYLKKQFNKYNGNNEIVLAIFDKYCRELNDFDCEIFKSRVTKFNDKIYKTITEFIDLSKSGNCQEALNLIEKFISNYSCCHDYTMEFFEKDIFVNYFDESSYIARDDLCMLYMAYGVILNDNNYPDKALKSFKKAYYLNPVNVDNLVELALYYLDIDLDKSKTTIDLGFKYAYTTQQFHELYLCLEQYYLQIGDFKKVKAIEKALDGDFEQASKQNIQIDFNEEVLKLLLDKLEYHIYENNYESAQYYLNVLMNMGNCHIVEISRNFTEFQEMEYIDFN